VTEQDPRAALLQRARRLQELGRHQDALVLVNQALAADPADAHAHRMAGWSLYFLDRYGEAEQAAGRAIALAPDASAGYKLLSWILHGAGARVRARRAARRAVELAPEDHEAWYALCVTEIQLWMVPTRAARRAADQAARLKPDSLLGLRAFSLIAQRAGQWRELERHARRILEMRPDDAGALNDLGLARLKRRRPVEAADLFIRSAREDPSQQSARSNLLWAVSRIGVLRRRAAVREFPAPVRELVRDERRRSALLVLRPLFVVAAAGVVLGLLIGFEPRLTSGPAWTKGMYKAVSLVVVLTLIGSALLLLSRLVDWLLKLHPDQRGGSRR
jgi:Flp pilus assembly protein TadD